MVYSPSWQHDEEDGNTPSQAWLSLSDYDDDSEEDEEEGEFLVEEDDE